MVRRRAEQPAAGPDAPIETLEGRFPRRDDHVRLGIDALDDDGVGVGTLRGSLVGVPGVVELPVAVRDALPGDRVLAKVTSRKGGVAYGVLVAREVVSPDRVAPLCPHAEVRMEGDRPAGGASCGGCTLQGLAYPVQLDHKVARVRRAMAEAGHAEVLVAEPDGAERRHGHRHKMEFSFGRGDDGALVVGLHPRGYRWEVLALEACPMLSPGALPLARAARDAAAELGLAARDERRGAGWLEAIVIRESRRVEVDGGPARLVELVTADVEGHADTGGLAPLDAARRIAEAVQGSPGLAGFVWTVRRAVRGEPTSRRSVTLLGASSLPDALLLPEGRRLDLSISARAFFQPHPNQSERIIARIVARLSALAAELGRPPRVADLYCGTGTLGLALAPFAAQVVGVELVPEAVEDAEANAARNALPNTTFIAGDVGAVLADPAFAHLFAWVDAAVVDPPRAGLMPKALGHLVALAPALLVYVSCNPAALARDLGPLAEAGFELEGPLQPIDLFPHTHHIETLAFFRRVPLPA